MSDIDNTGSTRDQPPPPASLWAMLLTLGPTAMVAAVYFTIFLILRRSQRRFYAPRTYLGSLRESERTPSLPSGLFNWFGAFWRIPDVHALQHQSLDAFLYLRFLKMTVTLCFVGCCITWPVLFPVNATGDGGRRQLDILAYGNVNKDTNSKYRYYAHVFIAWIYLTFILFLVTRECIYFINLRQAVLLSPLYSRRISSRTVLFTSVPEPYLDESRLRKMFGDSVKNIWLTADTAEVDKLVEERDEVAFRLEKAEVKLIKEANKIRRKRLEKGGVGNEEGQQELPLDAESGSFAARWIPPKKRPSHRLGPLGLFGKKVDSIEWCRTELERLIPAAEAAQAHYLAGGSSKIAGVFIEFRTQADAETATQVLTHHQGLHMTPRYIGITPKEVVWKSLGISWWQKVIRRYAVVAFITAMIIFWAIPVAAVGAISNINQLQTNVSWLHWLSKIPQVIMGFVEGLLPSVLLAILMSLVPVVMRLCAKLSGEPSLSRVELFTQNAYFAFQVVQVFLVTTLASSVTSTASKIVNDPSLATTILSQNLPASANFYINYLILQGLTIAAGVVSQIAGFVIFHLLYKYLAGTPRALYNKWANLSAISWGSTMPVYTNIAVIAITYSCIAPLILGWATIGTGLFYLAWRYNVLFVTDTQIDTRGLIYPRALKQLLTGIYFAEICMIGLFGASAQPGPLILMILFLVFTVLYHISLNSALDPLLYNLPKTLMAESGANIIVSDFPHDGTLGDQPKRSVSEEKKPLAGPEQPTKAGFLKKFLQPWLYDDYATQRQLLLAGRVDSEPLYTSDAERNAYYPPSVTSRAPLLWIPSDPAGISKQEVVHTARVIHITDEGCVLDNKGNLVWDREATRPPVWQEKILY